MTRVPDALYRALACPYCGSPLQREAADARCASCPERYGFTPQGALDLRLRRVKTQRLEFGIPPAIAIPPADLAQVVRPLAAPPRPEVDFSSVPALHSFPRALMSHIPRASEPGALALDLGCGETFHRRACEHAGFVYVGLDHASEQATVMGDAHALPFKNDSIDFILSLAVFEHIRYPFVAIREAYRVLRPGRPFIGAIAFLEPYHGGSLYHHTHMGVWNLLRFGGFAVEQIAPDATWPVLIAQASMILFPRMPLALSRAMVFPLQAFHRAWWAMLDAARRLRAADRDRSPRASLEMARQVSTAGAFAFIARK